MPTIEEQQATVQAQLDALQARPDIAMPTMARSSPNDGTRPGWLSLFGEALGGGQGSGYRLRGREEDAAGSRALLNFGINMLLASGPSRVRPDLLSAAATGLQGAQQSLSGDQQQAQAAAAADYKERLDQAKFGLAQDHSKIERIKAALPLLQLQQQLHQLGQPLPPELRGPPTGGPQAAADLPTDKAAALKAIAQRESGGNPTLLNYVAEQDPTAYDRGATASGKYQIVNSTWKEGLQLAGLDPSKYATARAAPEAVQDQVASVLWDKYGNKPWQKGAKDWVKDERGQYQLATVRLPAGSPGAPAPAPTAAAPPRQPLPPPTADVAPTGVQVSGPAGVASPGPAAPPSPAVAGNVGAIIAGMTGAGADATTLAPGAGGAAPGVNVAQAGPPAAQPSVTPSPAQEFDAYVKQNLRGGPDLTELERAKAIAQWRVKQAATLPERDKAAADVAAADVAIGQRKDTWLKEQRAELFKVWDADRTATRTQKEKIEAEERAHQRAVEMAKLNADNTAKQAVDTAVLNVSSKRLEELQGKSAVAQRTIRDTHALATIADQMGDPQLPIANNPKVRDALIALKLPGLVGANMNELQAGQLWDKLTSGFFQDTHVPGSGSQSDREGEWMMRQFGGPEQTIEDRHSQLAIIRKLADNRIADHSDAEDLFIQQGGKLTGLNAKIAQRSKLFDRPPEWKADDPEANIKAQGRYLLRHPRGEPYAAYSASPDGGRTPGELRYWRNEMVKDPTTGKSRLQPVPLLGGSMVAE